MHDRAPAASWDVKAGPVQAWVKASLLACSLLPVTVYLMMQPWGIRAAVLLLSLLCSATVYLFIERRVPSGLLLWTGEHWHWSAMQGQAIVRIASVLDLQRLLLLRVQGASGVVHWIWLHSDAMDSRWMALRRAVVSGMALRDPIGS